MKKAQQNSLQHSVFPIIAFFGVVMLTAQAQGQALYWDTNGSTAGAGGSAPSGTWSLVAQSWNNVAGDGTVTLWSNTGLETALFSAGNDATGSYTITLGAGAALKLAALTLSAGSVTLAGQSGVDGLDFGSLNAALTVTGGSTLSISSFINGGAGLTKAGTGTAILSSSTSLPTGAYVVQAGELQIADGITVNAGALTLGGSAGVAATLTLGSTAVFNLGGTLTYSNVGTPLGATIQGGTLNLNGSRAFTIQNITADPDLTIQSVIADGSAPSDLIKGGGGSLLLTGANTYTGATTIAGTLFLQGNSGSIAGSSALSLGAGAVVNIGAAADTVAVNRLGDAAAITLIGGAAGGASLNYVGANFAAQAAHAETVGALTFAGDHRSTITLTPGSGDELTITFASLARLDHAVAVVRGSSLSSAAGTADSTRVFFSSTPTLTGGILPWLLGDTSAAGQGTAFTTYDGNGLRVLSAGDYTAASAITAGANVLKSAGGGQAINASVGVNSWTSTGTGTTTLGSGVTLGITSGGMLFSANATITGGTLNLAGSSDGIVHVVAGAAVTATLNIVITGSHGLTLSGAGTGNKVLALGENNTFTGGVRVYGGILVLNHAGALNAAGTNALALQTGTVRLSGQQITVAGLEGDGTVQNFSSTVASTLRVNGTGTFTGALNNGGTATLGLTKAGNGVLSLQGNNQFTGATLVEQGVLQVGGGNNGGRLSGTAAITVRQGATLRVTNTNGNNVLADRVNDAASLTLAGGTFDFNNSAAAAADYSEVAGAVTLNAGASLIIADQAATGRTSTLSFASVARQSGATVNFTGGGSGLGVSTRNRLEIGGLSEGFIGGWATVGSEFAKYVADIDGVTAGNQGSITAFTAADYSTLGQVDWTSALHVKPTADQTLAASREVASVNLALGMDLALGGNTLTIASGGLIKQGGAVGNNGAVNRSQITNGTLTAGSTADAELLVRVTGANLNVSAVIANNAGGAVHVVKSGTGTLLLSGANTYTGNTYLNEGVLTVGSGGNGTSATQAGSVGRTGSGVTTVTGTAVLTGSGLIQGSLVLNGGTLRAGDTAGDVLGTLWVGGDATFNAGTLVLQTFAPTLNVAALADASDPGYAAALAALSSNAALGAAITLSQHDHLDIAGTFDWGTGAGVVSVLNSGYVPTAGDVFNLIDWSQVINAGAVNLDSSLAVFDLGAGFAWDKSLWASQGLLIVSTPEPTRALLLLAGIAAVGLRRRRLTA